MKVCSPLESSEAKDSSEDSETSDSSEDSETSDSSEDSETSDSLEGAELWDALEGSELWDALDGAELWDALEGWLEEEGFRPVAAELVWGLQPQEARSAPELSNKNMFIFFMIVFSSVIDVG